ncbi:MAG: DUF2357 domain-containing protein [Deltaproteobacteria bacterium]|nr:DUF2357 domain-containing protein [Deltaproteobacteria bacterium]
MAVLGYSPEVRMVFSNDPLLPPEEEVASSICRDFPSLILQDRQTYFVKFYGESVPSFFPKQGEYYNLRRFPGNLFEVGFRNSVGLTRIGPLTVRVESQKISEANYGAMLDFIVEKYANLIFSFAQPLGQGFRKGRMGQDIAYIEYLFIKRYLVDSSPNLNGISSLILANPHYQFDREFRKNSIEAIADVSPAMLINIFSNPNRLASMRPGHPLLSTACGRTLFDRTERMLYPTEAIEERKLHTVDTDENRFLKHFLQSLQCRLDSLEKVLKGMAGGYLNPDIEMYLGEIERGIGSLLADPLWHDVGHMHYIPTGSQVLQRREGYRQLFRLYSLLQLTTQCDFDDQDFRNLLETKNTPTLFEYWSFFVVKDILDGNRKILSCHPIVSNEPLQQRVRCGIGIKYEDGVLLWFNHTYQGSNGCQPGSIVDDRYSYLQSYSHNFKPDIVIEKDGKFIIFDAKYKGQGGGFYGEEVDGTIQSWKEGDIDKMHTYREAIENVLGAYILYPGEKAISYPPHGSQRGYEGVGALPLKTEAGARPVQRHWDDVKRIILEFIGK